MAATAEIKTEVRTVTPQEAEILLRSNNNNRKVRSEVVRKYVRDMERGEWLLNGEAIKISTTGDLIDGQHRLLACIESGVAFQTIVITGLPLDIQVAMDVGAKRTFSDILRWRGETSTASLASAIEAGMCWDEAGTPAHRGRQHSNAERLAWLDANPDIRDAVKGWQPLASAPLRFPMSVGGPFLMRMRRISPIDSAEFVQHLKSGANLAEDDPINVLRRWLLNASAQKAKRAREEYAAVGVKAWNAYLKNRPVRNLTWRSGGAHREEFPYMVTPSGDVYEEIITDPNYTPPGHVSVERMGFTRQAEPEGLPEAAVGG